MIVGAYLLHLYCDTAKCPRGLGENMTEYTHEKNERGAIATARRYGWTFDLESYQCWCPACSKAKGKR